MAKQRFFQEEEYQLPYHYIPRFKDDFCSHISWTWGYQYAATTLFLLEELQSIKFASILDIGCGDGRFVREVASSFPKSKVKGIDISERAIKLALALNPGLEFDVQDILTAKNPDGEKFDVLTMIEVIEHIPPKDLQNFVDIAFTFLKDDGYILLTTPSTNKKLSKKHFQHFTKEQLASILIPHAEILKLNYLHAVNKHFLRLIKFMYNKWFIVNYQPLLNWVFEYYRSRHFIDKTGRGHRFYILGRKK